MTSVVALLAEASAKIGPIGKDHRHSQGYSFRGVDDVVNAAGPVLAELGVVPLPEVRAKSYETVEVGSKRTPMQSCRLDVAFTFHGPAGDHVTAVVSAEAMDSGDKATSKAMSVALRTALIQVLQIATGDPDPGADAYERSGRLTVKQLYTVVKRAKGNRERLVDLYRQAENNGLLGEPVTNEDGQAEGLGELIVRWGKALAESRTAQRAALPEPALEES